MRSIDLENANAEMIIVRVRENCIIEAKTPKAKQRLIDVAMVAAKKRVSFREKLSQTLWSLFL